jgi:UDP-glucose 4-epimerase
MRVFVTGGAGYIGSVGVEKLLDAGHEVIVLDNMRTGRPASVSAEARTIVGDLRDGPFISGLLAALEPDAIMHFAAATIVPESVTKPDLYYGINMVGGYNLLEGARLAGVDKLIVSSTAAVYGAPEQMPITEDTPTNPVSPYGAAKLMFEQMLAAYAHAYGTRWIAFRYFNVAGATYQHGEDHRPETHLIPNALLAVAGRRPPMELYGTDYPTRDGTAIRDYVHVEDLIDAHLAGLERIETVSGPFNLGTATGASVAEVISAVESVTGREVPRTYHDRRAGDPPILVADATRARELLGWTPSRSTLDQMIGSAWDWMERNPNGYGEAQ